MAALLFRALLLCTSAHYLLVPLRSARCSPILQSERSEPDSTATYITPLPICGSSYRWYEITADTACLLGHQSTDCVGSVQRKYQCVNSVDEAFFYLPNGSYVMESYFADTQ